MLTRREFGKLALAGPAATLLGTSVFATRAPNSVIGGVQIGLIAPYSFGQDAPDAETPATIELEYPVPEGSTRVAEIGKCLQYCKDALA